MSARRYQVENHARWLGWTVKERGQRRIAVFFRRGEAREYARWLNERAGAANSQSDAKN